MLFRGQLLECLGQGVEGGVYPGSSRFAVS